MTTFLMISVKVMLGFLALSAAIGVREENEPLVTGLCLIIYITSVTLIGAL